MRRILNRMSLLERLFVYVSIFIIAFGLVGMVVFSLWFGVLESWFTN